MDKNDFLIKNKLFIESVGGCAYHTLSRVLEKLEISSSIFFLPKRVVMNIGNKKTKISQKVNFFEIFTQ